MNHALIRNLLGRIMLTMATLMLLPLVISLIYREGLQNAFAFLIPALALSLFGSLLIYKKPEVTKIRAKEGIVIVGLSWILMSLFGCVPFLISQEIPNFFDAFFEITSGFTTTGASVVKKVEDLSHSILFWRSFSHWIGGMGVLVFILAIFPESKDGSSMHILRAESPGPQVGKLVSKMQVSARILYLIYIVLTVIEILILWIGPDDKMNFFNSIVYSFGTAGTGGFSVDSTGLALYSNFSQYVIATFMIIFGINFTMFYFVLIKNWKGILKDEEVRVYFGIVIVSVIIITCSIFKIYQNFEQSFRLSYFQVASIVSTTGFATADYNYWGGMAQLIIVFLMAFGACAGSTAGGIKVSRLIILFKSCIRKIKRMINPRKVTNVKINGKVVDEETIEATQSFFIVYFVILGFCAFLISFDGFDVLTNITASLSCISNVGPGLNVVGPMGSFSGFSSFSKIVLSFEMIAGRLEIFPVLILFYPKTWMRR